MRSNKTLLSSTSDTPTLTTFELPGPTDISLAKNSNSPSGSSTLGIDVDKPS